MNAESQLILTEDQRDCLQEIVNVAMGQAGDSLARFLEVFVELSVPVISYISINELLSAMLKTLGEDNPESIIAVRQGFYTSTGHGLNGEVVAVFSKACFAEIAELLAYEGNLDDKAKGELCLDVSNIINGACLNGIAEQMEIDLLFSAPSLINERLVTSSLVDETDINANQVLLIEIKYTLEKHSFKCTLFLLLPKDGVDVLKIGLDEILQDD